ncbi:MAG: WG repeat-containing protein [Pyrinomonadaceae bacterium]
MEPKCRFNVIISASLVLTMSVLIVAQQRAKDDELFPVKVNGRFGYIDTKGRMVIRPQFDDAHRFQEGLAGVVMGGEKRTGRDGYAFYLGGKFGYIDRTGKLVVPLGTFSFGRGFSEGLAEVNVNGCKGENCTGYANKVGKLAIKNQFSSGSEFRQGLAIVEIPGGKRGVINKNGKFVVPAIYDGVMQISEGIIVANTRVSGSSDFFDNKLPVYRSVFLDRSGNITARPDHTVIGPFSEGLTQGIITVTVGSQDHEVHGVVDKMGKFVIEPGFQKVGDFVGGLAPAQIRNKWGFIDQTGKFVIEPVFDRANSFRNGLAEISVNRETGFIDRTGKMVIEPRSWTVEEFSGGHAFVTENGYVGYIDRTGKYLWKKKFDN